MELKETENIYIIEGEVECDDCNGTGLYHGMGEKGGAFVICLSCDGTGKVKVNETYRKFKERKKQPKCKRVYTKGMGYCISDKDYIAEGKNFPFSKCGCSYEEWLKGKKPIPLKFLGCPYQETNQHIQTKDVNNLYKRRCRDNLTIGGRISNCKLFYAKEICWKIYEGDKNDKDKDSKKRS